MRSRPDRAWIGLALILGGLCGPMACAARFYQPPSGPGAPFDQADQVWRDLTERCRTTSSLVAQLRVEGWTGSTDERFSATLHSALTTANDIYLEVPAPGRSFMQMAGRADQTVLLLPREERALRAGTRDIMDRLTGLRWDAVDLLHALTGCVVPATGSVTGVSYADSVVALELGNGARAWIRHRHGAWQLDAAARDGLLIEYRASSGGYPAEVRVSATSSAVTPLELTFSISQVQANTSLDQGIFVLSVPDTYVAIALDDLRSARPLRDGKGSP